MANVQYGHENCELTADLKTASGTRIYGQNHRLDISGSAHLCFVLYYVSVVILSK